MRNSLEAVNQAQGYGIAANYENPKRETVTTKDDLAVEVYGDHVNIFRHSDSHENRQSLYLSMKELETTLKKAKQIRRRSLLVEAKAIEYAAKDLSKRIKAAK